MRASRPSNPDRACGLCDYDCFAEPANRAALCAGPLACNGGRGCIGVHISPRKICAACQRSLACSTLKVLEHSSSRSPSDSAAPQCRHMRTEIARRRHVAFPLIARKVHDVAGRIYQFLNHRCPLGSCLSLWQRIFAETFSPPLKFYRGIQAHSHFFSLKR